MYFGKSLVKNTLLMGYIIKNVENDALNININLNVNIDE